MAAEAQLRWKVFDLERLTVRGPDGAEFTREVVRHPGSVAVLPFIGDDVVLLRQYRAPVDAAVLEIPAGTRDVAGEPPGVTAARECEEEIGFRPGSVRLLASFYNSPGYTDEHTLLFRADDLVAVSGRPVDAEEAHAEVVRLPFPRAYQMAAKGEIDDAKTVLALLLVGA